VRFFFKVNAEDLSIEEFAKYIAELKYLAELELINIKIS